MHISNCFNQFLRLEELSSKGNQVLITTHWYGYLPIAQNGFMHYLEIQDNQTKISSFNLYNLLESRKMYPDDVDLKSFFDLASSLISFIRREPNYKWIFCEGSDDKLYLQTMLKKYKNLYIIPLGGCGNVIKLYRIMYGFISEKTEETKAHMMFLIDTDIQRINIDDPRQYNENKKTISLLRLQVDKGEIKLMSPLSGGTYNQTEMEDCLNPEKYFEALKTVVNQKGDSAIKKTLSKYLFVKNARCSLLRGDDSCIQPMDVKYIEKKQDLIDFAGDDKNKYEIAVEYAKLCEGNNVNHSLADLIAIRLDL
jgi:hypothetical protein